MFSTWRALFKSNSRVEAIITNAKPVSLQEVLDQDDVVQECKQLNRVVLD